MYTYISTFTYIHMPVFNLRPVVDNNTLILLFWPLKGTLSIAPLLFHHSNNTWVSQPDRKRATKHSQWRLSELLTCRFPLVGLFLPAVCWRTTLPLCRALDADSSCFARLLISSYNYQSPVMVRKFSPRLTGGWQNAINTTVEAFGVVSQMSRVETSRWTKTPASLCAMARSPLYFYIFAHPVTWR